MKFKWGSIMDKKQAIIAAAALAGTTVIGVQTAQADTTDQPVQSQAAAQTVTLDKVAAQTKIDDAQQALTDSQGKLAQAKEAADQATTDEKQAQSNVDNAQQAVDDAQAKTISDSVTQGEIDKQQQIVADQQAVADAKRNAVDQAQTAEKARQVDVDQAKQTASAAEQAVSAAQAKVDQLQEIVDGKADVNRLEVEAKKTAADLANAKQILDQTQHELAAAQKAVEAAQKDYDNKQAADQELAQKMIPLQQQIDQLKAQIQRIYKQIGPDNAIVLPNMYLNMGMWDELSSVTEAGMALNYYQHNPQDKNIKVDPRVLTPEQQAELTVWAAKIINTLRAIDPASGAAGVEVTDSSLQMAMTVAANPKNTSSYDRAVGGTIHFFEALATGEISDQVTNMDALKEAVYNAMLKMVFADSAEHWNRTQQLVGKKIADFATQTGMPKDLFGLAIDQNGVMHFIDYTPAGNDSGQHYNTGSRVVNLAQKVQDADGMIDYINDQELATLQKDKEKTTQALKDAQTALQTAQQTVQTKEAQVNNLIDVTNQLQGKLLQVQADLRQAQEAAAHATKDPAKVAELEQAKADLQTKETAAADAQRVLDEKLAALKAAQDATRNAISEATVAQQTADEAAAQLQALKDQQVAAQTAAQALIQAQAALQKAQDSLATAKEKQAVAQAAYQAAQAEVTKNQAALAAAQAALAKIEAREQAEQVIKQAQEKAAQAKHEQEALQKSNLTRDHNRHLQAVAGQVKANASQAVNQTLPQTGDVDSNLTLAGVLALSMIGLLGLTGTSRKLKQFK